MTGLILSPAGRIVALLITPITPMFYQAPTPPQKSQPAAIILSSFDVQWGKPVFRAPDLPARVNVSAEIPFTPLRVTEVRKTK